MNMMEEEKKENEEETLQKDKTAEHNDDDENDNKSSSDSSTDSSSDDDSLDNEDIWMEKMDKARKGHRPSLKDWAQDGLANTFPAYVASLTNEYEEFILRDYEEQLLDNTIDPDVNKTNGISKIPVILDGASLTVPKFANTYEKHNIPAIIKNIPAGFDGGIAGDPWPAMEKWDFQAMEQNAILHNRKFKCGEDDDENIIKVKLKHFLKYMHANKDDSPLYIFCSRFDDDEYAKKILLDYQVPSYFKEDFFQYGPESRRPPYRWWLIGPERSGTCVHIDPLSTSAWNTLIRGKKRWVLFPPHLPKRVVKARGLYDDDEEDDESIHYFMYHIPRIKAKAKYFLNLTNNSATTSTTTDKSSNTGKIIENNTSTSSDTDSTSSSDPAVESSSAAAEEDDDNDKEDTKEDDSSSSDSSEEDEYADVLRDNISIHDPKHPFYNFECYEFTQDEGETIFVPCGWWHAVLNLTDTVAITQNFCSSQNFDEVWIKTRSGRKKFAWKWLCALDEKFPHLAQRARELNERDDYAMKYDPEVIRKREELEREMEQRNSDSCYQWKRRKQKKKKSSSMS